MNAIDVETLIEWLGPDGAIAGLEGSDLTVSDLYELASRYGFAVDKKMRRNDLINELINGKFVRIGRTTEELLAMDYEGLKKYFSDNKVSRSELLKLLSEFDIHPASEARKNLADFVAREISDLGMYERVAKGRRSG